jgi:hypothetical protein
MSLERKRFGGTLAILYDHPDTCHGTQKVVIQEGPLGMYFEIRVICDSCSEVQLRFVRSTMQREVPP